MWRFWACREPLFQGMGGLGPPMVKSAVTRMCSWVTRDGKGDKCEGYIVSKTLDTFRKPKRLGFGKVKRGDDFGIKK